MADTALHPYVKFVDKVVAEQEARQAKAGQATVPVVDQQTESAFQAEATVPAAQVALRPIPTTSVEAGRPRHRGIWRRKSS